MPDEAKEISEMKTPEQEIRPEAPKESSFEEKIKSLLEGKEDKPSLITDGRLQQIAKLALMSYNQTPEGLMELLATGNSLFLSDNPVPEGEWAELGKILNEKREALTQVRARQEVKADLGLLISRMVESQEKLAEAIRTQSLTMVEFLESSAKQTQSLAESLRRLPAQQERERWIDEEYRQEFYTRFTPTLEPRFFTELPPKERELFEDRWQLARAAFYKKAMAGFPEKLIENQDLQLLKIGQMERLYKMPGVRQALEWYVDTIANNRVIKLSDGREVTIWDCRDERDFEKFRERMRQDATSDLESLTAKEADTVAWNWIFCSNLIEARDSRYPAFKSGERHGRLPGVLVSDGLRADFHPQEKFESKCRNGEEWGAFGKWGVNQIKRIKEEAKFDEGKDEFEFQSDSRPLQYWTFERTNRMTDKGGRVIKVYAPECYPTTSMLSFWENVKPEGEERTLLEFLLDKEPVSWDKVKTSQPWVGYLITKLKKTVQLSEYFGGKIPFEEAKDKAWVDPLLDIYKRLELEEALGEDSFHNLKVWAFRASLGGVGKPHEKRLTSPVLPHYLVAYAIRLRNPRLGYLKRGAIGDWTGEDLTPK